MEAYKQIFKSDLSDVEKVAQAFDHVTNKIMSFSENEIELLKVMDDRDAIIKEQIKLSTVKHCRTIFADAFRMATGRSAWDA